MVQAILHIRQMTGPRQCLCMAEMDILKRPYLLTATTSILRHMPSATMLDHGRQGVVLVQE